MTRPSPICFRCGKKGHLSAHCTNAPTAKRAKATDAAYVIIDMTPWADEFAEWRKTQSIAEQREGDEDVNGLEETKGCATIDSGATVMCSSTVAAGEIQMQRINKSEMKFFELHVHYPATLSNEL